MMGPIRSETTPSCVSRIFEGGSNLARGNSIDVMLHDAWEKQTWSEAIS